MRNKRICNRIRHHFWTTKTILKWNWWILSFRWSLSTIFPQTHSYQHVLIFNFKIDFFHRSAMNLKTSTSRRVRAMTLMYWYSLSDGQSHLAWNGWKQIHTMSAYCHHKRTLGRFMVSGRHDLEASVQHFAIKRQNLTWNKLNRSFHN